MDRLAEAAWHYSVHVVSSSRFAMKAEAAGVDAIVAEGFEAGGHNGREETTTLCLIPAVRAVTSLPLIAAGGIATGEAILAMRALGADGVQVGTRFALTEESSASEVFKEYCLHLKEGDTRLLLKKLSPVRLARGNFQQAAAGGGGGRLPKLQGLRKRIYVSFCREDVPNAAFLKETLKRANLK